MSTWRTMGAVTRATARVSTGGGRVLAAGLQNAAANRGLRAVRSGVLVPGDPAPPPGSGDFYDYRGLVPTGALSAFAGEPYGLGDVVDLRSGQRARIGVGLDVLRRHAAVIGPTGSGKTSRLMIPWALTAVAEGHSVVMVDVAGDLTEQLLAAAAPRGGVGARVARWDLTNPSASLSWNWLTELDSHEAITAAVEALVGRERPNDPQPFFGQRDRRLLGGLIGAAREALHHPTPGQLLDIARRQDLLASLADVAPLNGGRLHEATQATFDYERIMSGVINALEVFEHPGLRAITGFDRLRLRDLFDQPSILIVGAPLHASRDGVAASSLMLSLLFRELYRGFGLQRRHVFVMADEAPRLQDRVNFEEVSSIARRAGVSLVLAAQFVEQFTDENQRHAILSNCATYVSCATPSEISANHFASRLGERRHTSLGQSVQLPTWQRAGGRQWSQAIESTPVLGLREIMEQPWSQLPALVHSRDIASAPIAVDLTQQF